MIKNNKIKLIIASVIIMLPALFGFVMWDKLPEVLSTHWGTDGNADGFMGKGIAILAVPLILLAFQWLCVFVTEKTNSDNGQNPKLLNIVIWIMPVISLLANGVIYAAAFDMEFDPFCGMFVLFGVMFILFGNYMPKCRQNPTLGIKIRWTLANEENWNATHRFAGKIWFFGGGVLLFGIFLPENIAIGVAIVCLAVLVLAPVIYSGVYYRKQVSEGRAEKNPFVKGGKLQKGSIIGTIVGVVVLIAVLSGVFVSAGFYAEFGDTSFTVKAKGWSDLTVDYSSLDSVELRDEFDVGRRISGFGTPTLFMGIFKNKEFGNYTVFAHGNSDKWVVINADGKVLVFAHKDSEATEELYQKLSEQVK